MIHLTMFRALEERHVRRSGANRGGSRGPPSPARRRKDESRQRFGSGRSTTRAETAWRAAADGAGSADAADPYHFVRKPTRRLSRELC